MSGIFKSTDTVVQKASLVDRYTGIGITGLTDVVVKVFNPDGTVLFASLSCAEVSGSHGIYGFTLIASQRTQAGIYSWEMSSPTANILRPSQGTFQNGGWVDQIVGLGSGNRKVTIIVQDISTHDPIPDVQIFMRDASDTTIEAFGIADSTGSMVFNLYDGTYKVYLSKMASYSFAVPETLVVSGDKTETYSGQVIIPVPPPDPELCLIYDWLYDGEGKPWINQKFRVSIYSPPPNLDSIVIGDGARVVETDATGYFGFTAFRGSQIKLDFPQAGGAVDGAIVLVPADKASIKLKTLLGLG